MSNEIVTKEKIALCLYFDADCNLESEIINNVMEAVNANLNGNIEVYIYLDRRGGKLSVDSAGAPVLSRFDTFLKAQGNNPWLKSRQRGGTTEWYIASGACYLKLSYDGLKQQNVLSVVENLGASDTGSSGTLCSFLDWSKEQSDAGASPATKYVLIPSDHGGGISTSFSDDHTGNAMIPQQLAAGIRQSKLGKVCVIAEDACLMAVAEAVDTLNGCADYAVASEDLIGGNGFNYQDMLSLLDELGGKLDSSMNAGKKIADTIVEANDGDYRQDYGVATLSASTLDGKLAAALNAFAGSSSDFTDDDWTRLLKAFADYAHIYISRPQYVDLAAVLNDGKLADDQVSEALKNALNTLRTALQETVSSKTTFTTELGGGLSIFSPIRADPSNVSWLFQELALTAAGNDSAWTGFLMTIYRKAQAAGLIADIDVNTLSGTFKSSSVWHVISGGTSTVAGSSLELESLCFAYYCFDHLQYQTLTEPVWYTFCTEWDDSYINTLHFEFVPADSSRAIQAGDFTVSIYAADPENNFDPVFSVLKYEGKNTAGSRTIDIDLNKYLTNKTRYCLRVFSETTQAEYSLTYSSSNPKGRNVTVWNDRFDYIYETGNNNPNKAVGLSGNYYSGLVVYKDDTAKKISHSDWYSFVHDSCELTVSIVGGFDGNFRAGDIVVAKYSSDDLEKPMAKAKGVYNRTTGCWDYVFKKFTCPQDEDKVYLKISAVCDGAYSYSIALRNIQRAFFVSPVLSTASAVTASGDTTLYWYAGNQASTTAVQLSRDEQYRQVLECRLSGAAARIYNSDTALNWRAANEKNTGLGGTQRWVSGGEIQASAPAQPRNVTASDDFVTDVLMARADGVWGSGYLACHRGFAGVWCGTGASVDLTGKNRITDVFSGGGTDAAVLFLTDDARGDALLADDIFSAMPEGMEASLRAAKLTDIYAGAGVDVIDLTSSRYAYTAASEGSLMLCGGDGNDALWANGSGSILCGDAGNDNLVGSSGDDYLTGGSGNDRIHGGGGNDVICFCKNWGVDTIQQLAGGSLTLWFASGSEKNWNTKTLTYIDGGNQVTVTGIAAGDITLYFGNDSRAADGKYDRLRELGLFNDSVSTSIYRKSSGGILA